MAGTTNRVELYPFSPPQKLERPDGFKTAAVSVDFGGNAVRLLVKEGSAGELIATGKPPGGEYSAILTVAGDSWSSETPVSELTVALPQIELLPEWELRDFPVSQSQARRFGTMRHLRALTR